MTENKHIVKYIGFIKKSRSDAVGMASMIGTACAALKEAELAKQFLGEVTSVAPLAVLIALRENRAHIPDEDKAEVIEIIMEHCVQTADSLCSEDAACGELFSELALSVYLGMEEVFFRLYNAVTDREQIFTLLDRMMQIFMRVRGGAEAAARLLCWLNERAPEDELLRFEEYQLFERSITFHSSGAMHDEVCSLAMKLLSEGNFARLLRICYFFGDMKYSTSPLESAELMRGVMAASDIKEMYQGLMLALNLETAEHENEIDAVEKWWSDISELAETASSAWQELRGWFEMYVLSRRIYLDPHNCDRYVSDAPVCAPTSHMPVNRSVKAVQRAVETLIVQQSLHIPEYLEKIENANIYAFHDGAASKRYASDSLSTVPWGQIIPMLVRIGYLRKDITTIYLNSFLRRAVRLNVFLRQMFAGTGGVNRGKLMTLKDLFGDYILTSAVHANEHGVIVIPESLNVSYVWIENRWKQENPKSAAALLKDGNTINIKITCCDISKFVAIAVPVDETGEVISDDCEGGYERLMALLADVQREGVLTTEKNLEISTVRTGVLTEDENAKLALEYLRCCAAIAENNGSVRYFINMINSTHMKTENIYRHNRTSANYPVRRYEPELFREVIGCWLRLKNSELSADDLFFIYVNTILRHCVSFSTMVFSRFGQSTHDPVRISGLLTRYTDYYFHGTVRRIDPKEHAVYFTPTEFSSKNRVCFEQFVYYYKPGDTYFTKGAECFFKMDYYDPSNYTFYLSEAVNSNSLRQRAPEAMFINAMLNASYSTTLSHMKLFDIISTEGIKLSYGDIFTLTDAVLKAIDMRAGDSTALLKYMTVIHRNNPWSFSLNELPDLSRFRRTTECRETSITILERICGDISAENIAVVYFNSPIKHFVSVEELIEIANEKFPAPDELVRVLCGYNIRVSGGKAVNMCCAAADGLNDGVYVLKADGTELLTPEICTSPMPRKDFTDRQLRQLLKAMKEEGKDCI